MTEHVLDASALLALMLGERGAEEVLGLLPTAVVGAVNLSEVVAKLQERGVPEAEIDLSLPDLDLRIIPFDEAQAIAAGKLRVRTRSLGLSLGDRACLALAMTRGAPVVTTDRTWRKVDVGVDVVVVRG
ncbi:MAG: type II toxin-antitoxin system VapC family toxin [Alphaproteobacteria bacterium]|nr:type II toxin-antitoxin system VapC family toxin [Alphaproteobacteria bacterium]MBV9373335.1 type II toxin-antitoxin system VapC family toxin [Alphaproteobacteria bacterium]MBV9902555.1 type II toxin-antitoxin system VapC family toxin [Alphaproteobacteria bacterium]